MDALSQLLTGAFAKRDPLAIPTLPGNPLVVSAATKELQNSNIKYNSGSFIMSNNKTLEGLYANTTRTEPT